MWHIAWLMIFSCFLLTGCVEKTSKLQSDFRVDDSKVFKDSFSIRDKTIPLPPGEWRIMGSGLNAEKFFKVHLIQEHAGKLFSSIFISVDSLELNREYGYIPSKEIQRKDLHHTVLNNNTDKEAHDWWLINNTIVHLTPKDNDSPYNEAVAYVKAHGYVITNDMISVTHFLSGAHPHKKRHLYVTYYYNPEAAGFPPGPKANWNTSDWNAMRVNEDPRKVAYIQELIKTHTQMHEKLKAGFHPN